jgi:hypothetical protein
MGKFWSMSLEFNDEHHHIGLMTVESTNLYYAGASPRYHVDTHLLKRYQTGYTRVSSGYDVHYYMVSR